MSCCENKNLLEGLIEDLERKLKHLEYEEMLKRDKNYSRDAEDYMSYLKGKIHTLVHVIKLAKFLNND